MFFFSHGVKKKKNGLKHKGYNNVTREEKRESTHSCAERERGHMSPCGRTCCASHAARSHRARHSLGWGCWPPLSRADGRLPPITFREHMAPASSAQKNYLTRPSPDALKATLFLFCFHERRRGLSEEFLTVLLAESRERRAIKENK